MFCSFSFLQTVESVTAKSRVVSLELKVKSWGPGRTDSWNIAEVGLEGKCDVSMLIILKRAASICFFKTTLAQNSCIIHRDSWAFAAS